MTSGFHAVARSHVGVVRTSNEDAGLSSRRLLAVADGMGGHAAGEVASSAVITTIANQLNEMPVHTDEIETWIVANVNEAHGFVGDLIAQNHERRGMGTTLSVLAACNDGVVYGHIGDSRIYRLRNGVLQQISRDHTYVQSLVDNGELTPEAALTHPRRNLLMRAIDGIHDVPIDLSALDAEPGDRFLLCSDGLSGVISDSRLEEILQHPDLTYVVSTLIEMALSAGAPDNVTAIIGEYQSEPEDFAPMLVGAALVEEVVTAHTESESETEATAWWHKFLPWLSGLALISVLIGGFSWWLSQQWFVGSDGTHVVIYQGIPQNLGPLDFSKRIETTELPIDSLFEVDLENVEDGVTAQDFTDAERIVAELWSRSALCLETSLNCES